MHTLAVRGHYLNMELWCLLFVSHPELVETCILSTGSSRSLLPLLLRGHYSNSAFIMLWPLPLRIDVPSCQLPFPARGMACLQILFGSTFAMSPFVFLPLFPWRAILVKFFKILTHRVKAPTLPTVMKLLEHFSLALHCTIHR